jgi:hypothetical protein
LGGPGFKSRPGDRLSWLRFLCFSSIPPGECRDSTSTLGHDRFLPNPFQFTIHSSAFHSTPYSQSYWKSVVNYTTNKIIVIHNPAACESIRKCHCGRRSWRVASMLCMSYTGTQPGEAAVLGESGPTSDQ